MFTRLPTRMLGLVALLTAIVTFASDARLWAQDKSKAPLWLHAMDLKARKAGELEFGKNTAKFGVEAYRDENTNNLMYIAETGSLSVLTGPKVEPAKPVKAPEWSHGVELRVRKAGEKDFNKDTKKFGVEVFKDENTGNLVYITEGGLISAVGGVKAEAPKTVKNPEWLYGIELRARKAGEKEFTANTKKYGIEVFLDQNNGTILYICETGSVAVLTGLKVESPKEIKSPEFLHGMDLSVRKAGEADFSPMTKKYGCEVFRDANSGCTIYITEAGTISVMAGGPAAAPKEVKPPEWAHGMEVQARKAGEADFGPMTKKFGIEVYKDVNANNLIYIDENVSISVVPGK